MQALILNYSWWLNVKLQVKAPSKIVMPKYDTFTVCVPYMALVESLGLYSATTNTLPYVTFSVSTYCWWLESLRDDRNRTHYLKRIIIIRNYTLDSLISWKLLFWKCSSGLPAGSETRIDSRRSSVTSHRLQASHKECPAGSKNRKFVFTIKAQIYVFNELILLANTVLKWLELFGG